MTRLSTTLWLGGIFTLALVVRLAATGLLVGFTAPPDAEANPDQLDYAFFAEQLAAGRGYTLADGSPTALRPPGTSLTLAPAYLVAGPNPAVGRVWWAILSAATCIVAVWLGWVMVSRAVGLAAGVLLACAPGHLYYAMHFVSETPFALWLTLALAAGTTALTHRRAGGWTLCSAAATAMAVLTRPMILPALPLLWLAAACATERRRMLKLAAVHTLLTAALLTPWLARNQVQLGKPTFASIGGHTFWGGNNEHLLANPHLAGSWVRTSLLRETQPLPEGELAMDAAAWQYGLSFVAANPNAMPWLTARKLWRFAQPVDADTGNRVSRALFAASWLMMLPLVGIGCVVAWRRNRVAAALWSIPIAATLIGVVVFYGSTRFRHSVEPLWVTAVAVGVVTLGTRWRSRRDEVNDDVCFKLTGADAQRHAA